MVTETKADKLDVLGIVSIILSISGLFTVIGLIVGLVGEHIAKKNNQSPVLSRIGWILGLSLTLLSIAWVVSVLLTGSYKAAN